ncbi:MAG: protein translocase subunit SecF [Betaproteobacteria bacterium]|nr:protein translocase subunit SecF [Betaproteobacteria bacterium]
MRFFTIKKNFNLMQHRRIAAVFSVLLIIICTASLITRGLNYSIDFTGGTLIEIDPSTTLTAAQIRSSLEEAGIAGAVVQIGGDGLVLLKLPPGAGGSAAGETALNAVRGIDAKAELLRIEFVGPQVSEELFTSAAAALLVVAIGISIYLSLRFKWRMAIGAIVANLHDVLFILGTFSLFGWEFGLPVLAAVLAILGYSVNETVVIFDRVRENLRGARSNATIATVLDASITQTWSRTIITHGSTQLAVLAMLLFGGEALFFFALALTIGIFSSIYSSILISGPVSLALGLSRQDFIEPKRRAEDGAIV